MKKDFLRLVLVGLFALSAGAAAAVFVYVPPVAASSLCPTKCSTGQSCPGSTCICKFDSQAGSYYCGRGNAGG